MPPGKYYIIYIANPPPTGFSGEKTSTKWERTKDFLEEKVAKGKTNAFPSFVFAFAPVVGQLMLIVGAGALLPQPQSSVLGADKHK